jgi:hypothetical protein
MRGFRLPPQSRSDPHSSGILQCRAVIPYRRFGTISKFKKSKKKAGEEEEEKEEEEGLLGVFVL